MRPSLRLFVCLAFLAAVGGCAGNDEPTQRDGTWQPENVNQSNLEAMVADKRELAQGTEDKSSPSALSAAAVRRLLTDHVKKLLSTDVGPGSQAPQPSGGQ